MTRAPPHPVAPFPAPAESRPTARPPAGGSERERLRYVDNLRLCAIVLVFVIHVCEVFNPWDEWHITNAARSRILGEVVVLMAPWIMPLVMLLAGVSAWYSLQHRDNLTYLRERTARVLLPLLAGTLILVPPQVWLERRLHHQFSGSLLAFYPTFFDGIYPEGNFSWHHLWFLAHLYGYSLLALPLFRHLQGENGSRALRLMARLSGGRGGVLWLALPLILERSLLWGLFPERHMLNSDWSNHALLFVAYVYGFVLAGTPWLRAAIDVQWRLASVVAVLGMAALMVGTWIGLLPAHVPPPYSLTYLAFWALYAFCAWAWMITALGLARRWLDRDLTVVRRGEASAYAWYVVHQPVIVAVAFVVVPWRVGIPAKATVLFLVAAAGTLVGTSLLRRLPFVSLVLGGPSRNVAA